MPGLRSPMSCEAQLPGGSREEPAPTGLGQGHHLWALTSPGRLRLTFLAALGRPFCLAMVVGLTELPPEGMRSSWMQPHPWSAWCGRTLGLRAA